MITAFLIMVVIDRTYLDKIENRNGQCLIIKMKLLWNLTDAKKVTLYTSTSKHVVNIKKIKKICLLA